VGLIDFVISTAIHKFVLMGGGGALGTMAGMANWLLKGMGMGRGGRGVILGQNLWPKNRLAKNVFPVFFNLHQKQKSPNPNVFLTLPSL
jgi:hypothetical protein